jgi:hypothetical protein
MKHQHRIFEKERGKDIKGYYITIPYSKVDFVTGVLNPFAVNWPRNNV